MIVSESALSMRNLDSIDVKRREAESDIAGFKEERLRDSLLREQANFRAMANSTNSYDPWGKPGNGAPLPRDAHKKLKFTEYDGFKNDITVNGLFDDLGIIRHNHNGKASSLPEKSLEESQARINSYRQELRMVRADRAKNQNFEFFDPWGKGQGNPRRSQDGQVERFAAIKEKGIVPQPRHSSFTPDMDGLIDKNIGVGLDTDSPYGGGGGPSKTRSGNIKTRFPTTMKRDIYGNMALQEEGYDPFKSSMTDSSTTYFPFGKPGGGAPLMTNEGRVAPQRRGVDFSRELDTSADVNKRRQAADEYLVELKKEINEQRRHRDLDRQDQHAPFGELAVVVSQGKVGKAKRDPSTGMLASQHKGTSDVTKHKIGIASSRGRFAGIHADTLGTSDPKMYYDQLSQLADERHKQRQADKQMELVQENQHSENWSDLWGRPGGGAPLTQNQNKKTKLDKALHHPDVSPVPQPPKVPKKLSNHENNFQLSEDRNKFKPQGAIGVLAPYATY